MSDEIKEKGVLSDICDEFDCDLPKCDCDGNKTESGILSQFLFTTLNPNTSGATSISIPVVPPGTPVVIATLRNIRIDDRTDRVWLTGVVGWQGLTNGTGTGKVDAIFSIFRNAPNTTNGQLIFSTRQSTEQFDESEFETASIDHVDNTPLTLLGQRTVSYFLTAQLPLPGSAANVIGPITFTAAEIERNPKNEKNHCTHCEEI